MCMKIKIFNNLFKSSIYKPKTNVPRPPITKYDPNNITQEEFNAYVHYLAKNKINRTFIEPAKSLRSTSGNLIIFIALPLSFTFSLR